ncbi:MAG: VWA domain-containing protein [Phycisphaera sp.]|nr:MAG: VWA domain-containing protein [Phycisphaera sp.]
MTQITSFPTIDRHRTVAVPQQITSTGWPPGTPEQITSARQRRTKSIIEHDSAPQEDIIITLDFSTSMGWRFDGEMIKLDAATHAATQFILLKGQTDPLDRVGIAGFDQRGERFLDLVPAAEETARLQTALKSIEIRGGTDIDAGLRVAADMLALSPAGRTRRIVLLTDGKGGDPRQTAERFKLAGGVLDIIAVGKDRSDVDEPLLMSIASVIDGELRYAFLKDHKGLVQRVTHISRKTKTC